MIRIVGVICAGLLAACGEPEPLHYTVEDGSVCVEPNGAAYRFVFDTGCLSSSCDPIEELSCATRRSGSTLILESEVWIGQPKVEACTDDCGTAFCPIPIDEGIATIQYGEKVVAIGTIPEC